MKRRLLCGLTLIELLVSILLGSLFSLAAAGVYLHSKRQFAADEAMARVQENGRFALHLVKRELSHAGFYSGIADVAQMSADAVSADCVSAGRWALNPGVPLELIDNFDKKMDRSRQTSSGTDLHCIEADEIVPGSDLLSVKRTAGDYTVKNGAMRGAKIKNKQWYLRIGDYGEDKSWFYHNKGGLPSSDLGTNTRVDYWEFYTRIFYIRRFSESPGDNIPSLCVEALSGGLTLGIMATRCLVEGVEDMQIEFGVDSDFDGVPNQFYEAPGTLAMGTNVAARISLLLRSLVKIPGQTHRKTYLLGRKSVTRDDGYYRRVFSTTIPIRNAQAAFVGIGRVG